MDCSRERETEREWKTYAERVGATAPGKPFKISNGYSRVHIFETKVGACLVSRDPYPNFSAVYFEMLLKMTSNLATQN